MPATIHRRGALAGAAALLAGLLARQGANADLGAIDSTDAPVPVTVPRDEGVHLDHLTEWWYFTGHLDGENGEDFGFQQVVFRASRGTLAGYVSHAAITDNVDKAFVYGQMAALPAMAEIQTVDGYEFDVRGLRMQGASDGMRLAGTVDAYSWDLELTPTKAATLHGGDGYVSNAAEAETYYYSYTQIAVVGSIVRDGVTIPVTGQAWFDHQWFMTPGLSEGGWDWFSLQFDDDRELMLYYIKDASGMPEVAIGTLVAADGSFEQVPGDRFVITPTATWTSPDSGGEYPVSWTVAAPDYGLDLVVEATLPNQELDTRLTTGVTYWEGSVRAKGTSDGAQVTGKGYVELTGYALGQDSTIP